MKREFYKAAKDKRGLSLIELIIVIAIMAILVGVLTPMFIKYVDRARKSKDVYTADQIARAVNVAFAENPEAYEAYKAWGVTEGGLNLNVSATVNGVTERYAVDLVASSGKQSTNTASNCFNGGARAFYVRDKRGSDGFYGVINRELGLSTTEMNSSIIPAYTKKKEGPIGDRMGGFPYQDLDRYRICKRRDNGSMEIWAAQPDPYGGYPVYRLWPKPDDLYRK
ncbi:MAG: type II secretion system GspH family protein [Lachnospiraceae bacterium]|nr:type II secretion system GspH family protein [Lachnospiraceae bacterium]